MTDTRLSRQATETLLTGAPSDARLSRMSVEVLLTGAPSDARLSRMAVDVLLPVSVVEVAGRKVRLRGGFPSTSSGTKRFPFG